MRGGRPSPSNPPRCKRLRPVGLPPHAAEDVAHEALTRPFRGVYVEANPISPDRTRYIAAACVERDVPMLVPHTTGLPQGQHPATVREDQ
jgi:hypothetical protein